MFDTDLVTLTELFTRDDGDDSDPILLVTFKVNADCVIVPQIPLRVYKDGVLNCLAMLGNALVSIQDVDLK